MEDNQGPLQRYRELLEDPEFVADPAQARAVELLQDLHERLIAEHRHRQGWLPALRRRWLKRYRPPVRGLYLWGGVGRGKTCLVDLFYEGLPFETRMRLHFHRFMRRVHRELNLLGNRADPLRIVAERLAAETQVICFDEFHVSDITDAMLLGNLLEALFQRGVTLVATSNEHPDELYRDGLQRDRFLPAIELLKRYTRVVEIDSGVDYRLQFLDAAEIYHFPLDERGEAMLESGFRHLAPERGSEGEVIEIENREIPTVRCADGVAWFDFRALCDGPRGPADYIEIGRLFQTVLIANVPPLDDASNDQARRFISLIDEFYDRNVRVMLTAAVPLTELYTGSRLAGPFERTRSRLVEMQSHEYLAGRHRP